MKTKKTNKTQLIKGIQNLAFSLPLLFASPVVLHTAFQNPNHPWYVAVIGLGCILGFLAILFIFRGIRTVMQSMFTGKQI